MLQISLAGRMPIFQYSLKGNIFSFDRPLVPYWSITLSLIRERRFITFWNMAVHVLLPVFSHCIHTDDEINKETVDALVSV